MGLFSKRKREPVVHPDVTRRIHVSAGRDAVVAQLAAYDELGFAGEPVPLRLAEAEGWTTVVLGAPVHPWAFHNLAMWLMDTAGGATVVAVADPGDGQPGYWLVDDEHDSWMAGYDDRGEPITVSVSDNGVVRGDAHAIAANTRVQAMVAFGVPAALHAAAGETDATVSVEDPQHDLNPTLDATRASRKKLAQVSQDFGF